MLGASETKRDDSGPAVLTALPPPPGSKGALRSVVQHSLALARPHGHAAAPQAASHDIGWGEFQGAAQPKLAAPQGGTFFAANPPGQPMYRALSLLTLS